MRDTSVLYFPYKYCIEFYQPFLYCTVNLQQCGNTACQLCYNFSQRTWCCTMGSNVSTVSSFLDSVLSPKPFYLLNIFLSVQSSLTCHQKCFWIWCPGIRLQNIFYFFHYLPGLLPENLSHLHLSLQMSSQESVYGWEWTIFLKQMLFMLKSDVELQSLETD